MVPQRINAGVKLGDINNVRGNVNKAVLRLKKWKILDNPPINNRRKLGGDTKGTCPKKGKRHWCQLVKLWANRGREDPWNKFSGKGSE